MVVFIVAVASSVRRHRSCGNEVRTRAQGSTHLQQAKRGEADRVKRKGGGLDRLDEHAITEAIAEQTANLRAHLQRQLRHRVGLGAEVVHDGRIDVELLQHGEEAARRVQARNLGGRVEEEEIVRNTSEGGELILGLVAPHADDAVRVSGALGLRERVEGHGAGQRRLGQRGGRDDGVHRHVCESLQRLARHSVILSRHRPKQQRVRGGDVLEGKADNLRDHKTSNGSDGGGATVGRCADRKEEPAARAPVLPLSELRDGTSERAEEAHQGSHLRFSLVSKSNDQ
eukprot:5506159-Pleurochrysis_carterae.AAC.1